jgi:membrane-associated protease RseP (regulator of RpoE activity)
MKRWFWLRQIRIFDARLYVHWSVVSVVALLALISLQSPIHAAVSIASYLAVILIHEAGHAFMARRLGYEVHTIRLGLFHGLCEFEAPETELDHVLISWAGVLAQLAVAVPILVVAVVFESYDFGYAAPALAFLGYLNLLTALFNLAPTPPLDGAIAWRVIPMLRRWWKARRVSRRALSNMTRRR